MRARREGFDIQKGAGERSGEHSIGEKRLKISSVDSGSFQNL